MSEIEDDVAHLRITDSPWVNAAFICKHAVREGPSWTFREVHSAGIFPPGPDASFEVTLVIVLVGEEPRTSSLIVLGTHPGEEPGVVWKKDGLLFDGPTYGHVIAERIRIAIKREGTIWFDVIVDGMRRTRIPFNVRLRLDDVSPT